MSQLRDIDRASAYMDTINTWKVSRYKLAAVQDRLKAKREAVEKKFLEDNATDIELLATLKPSVDALATAVRNAAICLYNSRPEMGKKLPGGAGIKASSTFKVIDLDKAIDWCTRFSKTALLVDEKQLEKVAAFRQKHGQPVPDGVTYNTGLSATLPTHPSEVTEEDLDAYRGQ